MNRTRTLDAAAVLLTAALLVAAPPRPAQVPQEGKQYAAA